MAIVAILSSCWTGCSAEPAAGGGGGSAGSGGSTTSGGASGAAGATAGSAGAAAGSGGAGGLAGSGAGGVAGSAGSAGGGAGGTAGSAGTGGSGGNGGSSGAAPFVLTSPAFEHHEDCSAENHAACDEFPQENLLESIGGSNASPELNWGPGPVGTMSYAIVLHDYSNGFTHWAMWNIPASTLQLPADLPRGTNPTTPAGAQQVSFGGGDPGYQGPGADDHVYEFRLYALSVLSFSPDNAGDQGAVRNELENDAEGIVLGTSDLRAKSPP